MQRLLRLLLLLSFCLSNALVQALANQALVKETLVKSLGYVRKNIEEQTRRKWVVDVTGTRVELSEAPQKIVCLAPSLGELAAKILEPLSQTNRIVGVSEYTDYPEFLNQITRVGPYQHFNMEKVVALHPDLVLATEGGNSMNQIEMLRNFNIPVVVVATESFSDMGRSIRLVGQSIGNQIQANYLSQQLREGVQKFRHRAKRNPPLRVLLQVGSDPFMVVGGGTFLQEAVEILGAELVYGKSRTHYPKPSLEDLIRQDPDVIVILSFAHESPESQQMFNKWKNFKNMRAVRTNRVHVLKCDSLLRPTPRILEGLEVLERTLYGRNLSR